jgi:hypothetical protein
MDRTQSFEEKAKELRKSLETDGMGGRVWTVPWFGSPYAVSVRGVADERGIEAAPALSVVLMEYVRNGGIGKEDSSPWISYRECRGAGPLMGYFHENTGKTLERAFAGRSDALKAVATALGGEVLEDDRGFDLTLRFEALPGIPVLLRFNDDDEGFPASCGIMFRESSQDVLDIRSLGVIGTWLTGKLIGMAC